MIDRREAILARLLAILETVSGVQVAVRNRGDLPADKRPAVVILDGDEVARDQPPASRGQLTAAPSIIDLTPEIYVLMDLRGPANEGTGEDMNVLRRLILIAIMNDETLRELLGANGDITYIGCETDMASGRSLEGQMHLMLTFAYVLRPSEL